jgi:hypothetical protein
MILDDWELTVAPELAPDPSAAELMRAKLLTSQDLDGIPEPTWLIDQVLMENTLAWLYGAPGSGKSFVALDFAASVALGQHWQSRPAQQGEVIYLAAEGASGMRKRVRAWEKSANGGHPVPHLRFYPEAIQVVTESFGDFTAICQEDKAKLIILDTQARVTVGIEENSSMEMGRVLAKLEHLRRCTGACILVVHHTGWQGEHARGSSAVQGGFDTVLRMDRPDKESAEVKLSCDKQKDAEEFAPIELRMVKTLDSLVLAEEGPVRRRPSFAEVEERTRPLRRKWWDYAGDKWVSVSQLDNAKVVSRSSMDRNRFELIGHGFVAEEGSGPSTRLKLLYEPATGIDQFFGKHP